MPSRVKTGSRGLTITHNPYGFSVKVGDRNPETMFLPPDRKELRQALKRARTVDTMPPYKKKS